MAKRSGYLFIVIISLLFLSPIACVNNNEEDLYGIQECDTSNVTWDSKIKALLAKRCVECHGPVVAYNGVRHDSYESEMIVVNDGRLRGVVNHFDGYARMPKDRGKLPECELKLINIWLDNGAPEN